jgi:uncharacterized protein YbjT (DUF2867 family)|tara:strand:+ start:291 stop:650 length:360 start_codon:yes stop_codon:yes gene_type:complete
LVASAAGNSIVKVPLVTVLSEPKAMAATALLDSDELYIKAAFAVNDADVKLTLAKSQTAVVLSDVGVTLVSVAPPDVYAVPDEFVISFVAEKAVVPAPSVAELVNNAILKVSPVVAVKS